MSCGTPVVGFNETGLEDIIDHKINGYLAKNSDVSDLVRGIKWIFENEKNINFKENCTQKIHLNFSFQNISKKYFSLYKNVLEKDI